jgi:hypothetical protein
MHMKELTFCVSRYDQGGIPEGNLGLLPPVWIILGGLGSLSCVFEGTAHSHSVDDVAFVEH